MALYRVPPPANDEASAPQIRVEGLDSAPLCVDEVEIFDALISSVEDLTKEIDPANDNPEPRPKENRP